MMRLRDLFSEVMIVVIVSIGLTLSWSLLALSVFCVSLLGLLFFLVKLRDMRFKRLDWLVLSAVGYFAYRALISPVWDLAKEDLILMAGGVIVYYLSRLAWSSRGWIIVFSSCVLVNLMPFILQMLGVVAWLPLELLDESASQTTSFGLFQDYGAMGNAMAVIGVVLFSFAICARHVGSRLRLLGGVIGTLAFVLAYLSGSRSAVISVAVAGCVMLPVLWLQTTTLSVQLRGRTRLLLVGCALCVSVLAASLSMKSFVERDGKMLQTGVATESNVRQGYWGIAIDQWQQAPVLGQGARVYSYKSLELWDGALSQNESSPEFVHNEYLQLLADYGVLGMALLIVLLGAHWWMALRSLLLEEKSSQQSWLQLAGLLGVTVMMVHSFTDFPLRLPFNMFLAAVCLAWTIPARQRREERGERLKQRGLVVILMLFSAGAAVLSGREVWAATPLLLKKQAREDGAWSPVGHEDTLEAYELANERSPDFRRSQRIAQIYHLAYERGDESTSLLAEKFYKDSLDRHPYNPVPLLNLANLYRDVGEYTKSEVFYDRAESFVSARDSYFKYYVNRAKLSIVQAEKSYAEGNIVSADKYLESAMLELKESKSDWKVRLPILRDCYVARVRMAVESESYEEAEMLWRETQSEIQPWVLRRRGSNNYYKLGEAYCDAASKEWRMRKPELAKELYLQSKWFYSNDKNVRKGLTDLERDTKLKFVEQALRTLEEGGF